MSEPPNKPIPLWLALSTLVILLLSGSLLIYKYLHRPPKPALAIRALTPQPGQPNVARNNPPQSPPGLNPSLAAKETDLPDGLHTLGETTLIKAGDAYIKYAQIDNQPRYAFGYFTLSDLEWEHAYLTQATRRLLAQEDYAKSLNLTTTQRKALEALPDPPNTKWSPSDQKSFATLFTKYQSTPPTHKPPLANELTHWLATYATTKRTNDQKRMTARLSQIKSILTPDQQTKANPIQAWNRPTIRPG